MCSWKESWHSLMEKLFLHVFEFALPGKSTYEMAKSGGESLSECLQKILTSACCVDLTDGSKTCLVKEAAKSLRMNINK